jgi:hypothetical protein
VPLRYVLQRLSREKLEKGEEMREKREIVKELTADTVGLYKLNFVDDPELERA